MLRTGSPAVALLAATLALPSPAGAQDKPAADRYAMQPVDGGVVRLDRMTGEMSLCRVEAKKMACDMASDQRSALQARIDRLEKRVLRLEEKVRDRTAETAPLPSDKDLDRAMTAFERVMRHLFKMVDNLNRDFRERPKPEDGSAAGPQRT